MWGLEQAGPKKIKKENEFNQQLFFFQKYHQSKGHYHPRSCA